MRRAEAKEAHFWRKNTKEGDSVKLSAQPSPIQFRIWRNELRDQVAKTSGQGSI
jgi:hypothetical protein